MSNDISGPEIHEFYSMLKKMMRLQLEYAIYLTKSTKCGFIKVLNEVTEAYYYSDFYNADIIAEKNPQWMRLADDLLDNMSNSKELSFDAFWRILSRYIDIRLRNYIAAEKSSLQTSYYGFTFEYHPMYLTDSLDDVLTLHFRNYFKPNSPFKYTAKLKQGIQQIITIAKNERPDIKQVQCGSWLNCLEVFRNLFGPTWKCFELVEVPVGGNLGWWGQFIDKTGGFNSSAAERFKKTWKFEKTNQIWYCKISDLSSFCEAN